MKNMSKLLLFLMLLFAALGVNAQVSNSVININSISINGQVFPNNTVTTTQGNTVHFSYSGTGKLKTTVNLSSDVAVTFVVNATGFFVSPPYAQSNTQLIWTSGTIPANGSVDVDLGDYDYSVGNRDAVFRLSLYVYNPGVTTTASALVAYAILNDARPLPVTLTAFTARVQSSGVVLNWNTASEINFDYYEVQSSTNGYAYTNIAKVNPKAGSTVQARDYVYYDGRNTSGIVYYRLRVVDVDGSSVYSPVQAVTIKSSGVNILSSTVVKFGDHYFSYELPDELAGYVLTDLTGRVVFKQDNASPLTYQPNDGRVYVLRVLTKSGQTVNHLVQ